jgi:hypothetical protein
VAQSPTPQTLHPSITRRAATSRCESPRSSANSSTRCILGKRSSPVISFSGGEPGGADRSVSSMRAVLRIAPIAADPRFGAVRVKGRTCSIACDIGPEGARLEDVEQLVRRQARRCIDSVRPLINQGSGLASWARAGLWRAWRCRWGASGPRARAASPERMTLVGRLPAVETGRAEAPSPQGVLAPITDTARLAARDATTPSRT